MRSAERPSARRRLPRSTRTLLLLVLAIPVFIASGCMTTDRGFRPGPGGSSQFRPELGLKDESFHPKAVRIQVQAYDLGEDDSFEDNLAEAISDRAQKVDTEFVSSRVARQEGLQPRYEIRVEEADCQEGGSYGTLGGLSGRLMGAGLGGSIGAAVGGTVSSGYRGWGIGAAIGSAVGWMLGKKSCYAWTYIVHFRQYTDAKGMTTLGSRERSKVAGAQASRDEFTGKVTGSSSLQETYGQTEFDVESNCFSWQKTFTIFVTGRGFYSKNRAKEVAREQLLKNLPKSIFPRDVF